jgi:hypothetical protein
MKWLTNVYDPERWDARAMILPRQGETRDQAWQRQQEYLADKIIGLPKASEAYTAEELGQMGMVGVYAPG